VRLDLYSYSSSSSKVSGTELLRAQASATRKDGEPTRTRVA
jgi:hypothetical protein